MYDFIVWVRSCPSGDQTPTERIFLAAAIRFVLFLLMVLQPCHSTCSWYPVRDLLHDNCWRVSYSKHSHCNQDTYYVSITGGSESLSVIFGWNVVIKYDLVFLITYFVLLTTLGYPQFILHPRQVNFGICHACFSATCLQEPLEEHSSSIIWVQSILWWVIWLTWGSGAAFDGKQILGLVLQAIVGFIMSGLYVPYVHLQFFEFFCN